MQLLFVCSGNICRSPTAEAVMRHLVRQDGLQDQIEVDSAGIGPWHVGERADPRAREVTAARGIEIKGVARQIEPRDLDEFDLVLAADAGHHRDLLRIAGTDQQRRSRVRMLREFDPETDSDQLDIPDPYYGGTDEFERVLDLAESACRGLLAEIQSSGRLRTA